MAVYHKGGGGYGLNKMSTLQFMDEEKVSKEIWARNLVCEVPDCSDRAVALARHGVTMLMCLKHDALFKSDKKVGLALTTAMRSWLQFHLADISNYAFEGAEDQVVIVGSPTGFFERAQRLMQSANKMAEQNERVTQAGMAPPVITFGVISIPTVRPPIATLNTDNEYSGMQLFH